jgi:hypothetical protein
MLIPLLPGDYHAWRTPGDYHAWRQPIRRHTTPGITTPGDRTPTGFRATATTPGEPLLRLAHFDFSRGLFDAEPYLMPSHI